MNNEIRNSHGKVIGFRCRVCDKIKPAMWGEICNSCRQQIEFIDKLASAISRIKIS